MNTFNKILIFFFTLCIVEWVFGHSLSTFPLTIENHYETWSQTLDHASEFVVKTLNSRNEIYQLERLKVEESTIFGGTLYSLKIETNIGENFTYQFLDQMKPKFAWLGISSGEEEEEEKDILKRTRMKQVKLIGPIDLYFPKAQEIQLKLPHDIDAGRIRKLHVNHGVEVNVKGLQKVELLYPLDLSIQNGEKNVSIKLSEVPKLHLSGYPLSFSSSGKIKVKRTDRESIDLANATMKKEEQLGEEKPVFFMNSELLENLHTALFSSKNVQGQPSLPPHAGPLSIKRIVSGSKAEAVNFFHLSLELKNEKTGSLSDWKAIVVQNSLGHSAVLSLEKQASVVSLTVDKGLLRNGTLPSHLKEFMKTVDKPFELKI